MAAGAIALGQYHVLLWGKGARRGDILKAVKEAASEWEFAPQPAVHRTRHRPIDLGNHIRMFSLWLRWQGKEGSKRESGRRLAFYAEVFRSAQVAAGRPDPTPMAGVVLTDIRSVWPDPSQVNDLSTVRKALAVAERICGPLDVGHLDAFLSSGALAVVDSRLARLIPSLE